MAYPRSYEDIDSMLWDICGGSVDLYWTELRFAAEDLYFTTLKLFEETDTTTFRERLIDISLARAKIQDRDTEWKYVNLYVYQLIMIRIELVVLKRKQLYKDEECAIG